jgi:hypothetical protein
MSAAPQIRRALMENLKGLHLPAMRECFEQAAQQAEKETLSYEQYLLQLTERECESRRRRMRETSRRKTMRVRKDLASVLAVIWNPRRTQTPIRIDRCEHCGATLSSAQISIKEIAGSVVFGSLLLAVLTLADYVGNRWLEHGTSLVHPAWREPLDDWSR